MARVGAQVIVRWPRNGEEFFLKLNQPGIYMAGPESHSAVTDAKEGGSLRASEKNKANIYFELICIGYGERPFRGSKVPLLAEYMYMEKVLI